MCSRARSTSDALGRISTDMRDGMPTFGELVMNETDTIEQLLAGAETAVLAVLKDLPSRSSQHLRLNSARWQLQEALLRIQQMQHPRGLADSAPPGKSRGKSGVRSGAKSRLPLRANSATMTRE